MYSDCLFLFLYLLLCFFFEFALWSTQAGDIVKAYGLSGALLSLCECALKYFYVYEYFYLYMYVYKHFNLE